MKINRPDDLARIVRERRSALDLTQAEVAERAGVSRKWVYEFEAGKSTAALEQLLRVLDALDLDLDASERGSQRGVPGRQIDLDDLLDGLRDDG